MFWGVQCCPAMGAERFPAPEFGSGYLLPSPDFPDFGSDVRTYADVAVLAMTLTFSCLSIFKWRSRFKLYLLAIFSVFYFGFYKNGCVCSVGSIQNVSLAVFQPNYLIPFSVLSFFLIPLVVALFYGRVFCSGVCPLGAIQELVIYKPTRLPRGVAQMLSVLPYLYLGLAVLMAATGSSFIICQYDPFIGFFRLSAAWWRFALGAGLLIVGLFIARPYCRFLCPYGVLLGIFSHFSKRHLSVTPSECIQCRLCEQSCPVDALEKPSLEPDLAKDRHQRQGQAARTGLLIIMIPLLMGGMGFGFYQTADLLALNHRTVRLAEQILLEESGDIQTTAESRAFRAKGLPVEQIYEKAQAIMARFKIGAWLLGCFLGLMFSLKLLNLLRYTQRQDYEPNRFHCVNCGRCMEYCPVKP